METESHPWQMSIIQKRIYLHWQQYRKLLCIVICPIGIPRVILNFIFGSVNILPRDWHATGGCIFSKHTVSTFLRFSVPYGWRCATDRNSVWHVGHIWAMLSSPGSVLFFLLLFSVSKYQTAKWPWFQKLK